MLIVVAAAPVKSIDELTVTVIPGLSVIKSPDAGTPLSHVPPAVQLPLVVAEVVLDMEGWATKNKPTNSSMINDCFMFVQQNGLKLKKCSTKCLFSTIIWRFPSPTMMMFRELMQPSRGKALNSIIYQRPSR
jgi:hypothetical protein